VDPQPPEAAQPGPGSLILSGGLNGTGGKGRQTFPRLLPRRGRPEESPNVRHQTDARNWAKDQEAAIRGGTFIDPRAGGLSFGRYAESWLVTHRQSPGRVDQVARTLRRHILPALGNVPMRALNPRMLQAWSTARPAKALPHIASPPRLDARHHPECGVDDEVLTKSPYRKVQLPG
jgi:hypothetical protein